MLANVSYNNKVQRQEIDAIVVKPYPLLQRIKFGGVGSPKLYVTSSSKEIEGLFVLITMTIRVILNFVQME